MIFYLIRKGYYIFLLYFMKALHEDITAASCELTATVKSFYK